jgi:hypothetical protein
MTPTHDTADLSALAAGLCQDAGIGVELGQGWDWDATRRVLVVAEGDLRVRGADWCAAVLAHEVGHYFVTRHHLFTVPFPLPEALPVLMNGIEDPRANAWIVGRYPGTARWLARLDEEPPPDPVPAFIVFCRECAREPLRSWHPSGHEPDIVAQALDETRDARRRYAETLPPTDLALPPHADVMERYRAEVWPAVGSRGTLDVPSFREMLTRLRALEALRIARDEILPVAARLLEHDVEMLRRYLDDNPGRRSEAERSLSSGDRAALERMVSEAQSQSQCESGSAAKPGSDELAQRMLRASMQCSSACEKPGAGTRPMIGPSSAPPSAECEMPGRGVPNPGAEAPPPRLRFPPPTSTYDRAMTRVAGQLHHLTTVLEDLLRPRRRLHETAGYRSGNRLDLRRVMAFEADPRLWDKLWRRKSIPDRHQTIVSLLVDLSGSMHGPKTDAAQAGTILMAEALHRLQIPFAVNGFQDRLIRFAEFHDGLTERVRRAVGEMPLEVAGRRQGGNNTPSYNDDGPCLREAAEQLLSAQADDRILIVVSDGMPAGRRSTEQDLRNVIRLLVREPRLRLIGVGIGPDTDHVRDFYPNSRASVPLERFAGVLAELLRAVLE